MNVVKIICTALTKVTNILHECSLRSLLYSHMSWAGRVYKDKSLWNPSWPLHSQSLSFYVLEFFRILSPLSTHPQWRCSQTCEDLSLNQLKGFYFHFNPEIESMHLIFTFPAYRIKITMKTNFKGIKAKIMGKEKRNIDKGLQPCFGNCTSGNRRCTTDKAGPWLHWGKLSKSAWAVGPAEGSSPGNTSEPRGALKI